MLKNFPAAPAGIANQIKASVLLLMVFGGISVLLFPTIDRAMGSAQPSLISVVGPALCISLITVGLLYWFANGQLSFTKRLLGFMITYNILMVFVKFTLSPTMLFVANQEFHFEGQFADTWSSPGIVMLAIIVSVFIMYMVVFTLFRKAYQKRLGIVTSNTKVPKPKSAKGSRANVIVGLVLVGLAIMSGGTVLLLPLFALAFATTGADPLMQYLSFMFSGVAGIMMMACLASAAGFLGMTFEESSRISIKRRDLSVFISVVWLAIALLVVYHILWAVYMFVLVTFWPFRVTTVVPK